MRCFVLVTALFAIAPYAFAQRLGVGVKVGGVPTDVFQSQPPVLTSYPPAVADKSKHWTVGPSIEFEFWKGLGVEVDALYRHVGYDGDSLLGGTHIHHRERDSSWEFPILGKYRFLPASQLRPFVVAGYAPRKIFGSYFRESLVGVFGGRLPPPPPSNMVTADVSYSLTHGFVVGGGVDLKVWHLQISPEFRYTKWSSPVHAVIVPYPGFFGNSLGDVELATQNQAEILVGISFR